MSSRLNTDEKAMKGPKLTGADSDAAIITLRMFAPPFFLGVFLFRGCFFTAWRSRCGRFSLLYVLHGDGCRR